MTTINYQWVFGVPLGQELREEREPHYQPCPAVAALRSLLQNYQVFGGGRLQGTGPLNRTDEDGTLIHEFTRHHAGLALDIMVTERPSYLGQNLFRLFMNLRDTLRWRGMIHEHVSATFSGQPSGAVQVRGWQESDHLDHLHIDWFDRQGVVWAQVEQIPLRRSNGQVVTMRPKEGNRIAASITWPEQAMTSFSGDATVRDAVGELMQRYPRGLTPLDLRREVGLSR